MTQADVSVIIPAFNAAETLDRAVTSIMAQTQSVREILIYDDCSTDDTAALLDQLASHSALIKPVYGTTNAGAGVARARLLQAAQGAYFAFLDADDVWFPDKIERQMAVMTTTGAGLSCTGLRILGPDDTVVGMRHPPQRLSYQKMLLDNAVATSSAIVHSDLIGAREMPDLRRRQDYAYWLRLFQENPGLVAVGLPDVLVDYHRGPASLSSSRVKNLRGNFEMFNTVLGFSPVMSIALTGANAIARIFKA